MAQSQKNMSRRAALAGALGVGAVAAGGAGAQAPAPPGRVSYWHNMVSQTEYKALARIQAQFRARYPDIQLVPEGIPNAEYMAKATAAHLAGSSPDVGTLTALRFADMQAMGGLVDLTDRIAAWPLKDDFGSGGFSGVAKDGRIYGVPNFSFVYWVYCRKDWFDELGLAPPDDYPQMLEACIKLTDPAKGRYGFGLRGGDGGHVLLTEVIRGWGSPIVEDGRPALDRAKTIEAVRFFSELFTKHKVVPPSAPNDSYRQIMEAFKTGQTAMVWHHTGSLVEISAAMPAGSFMTAIRPKGPAARVAEISYQYNSVLSPRNVDAAWAWVSFWGETEPAVTFLEETGYFPASLQAARAPQIVGNPLYKAAVDTLAFGTAPLSFRGAEAWSANIAFVEFQKVLVGRSSVEDAVDTMIRGLERTLR